MLLLTSSIVRHTNAPTTPHTHVHDVIDARVLVTSHRAAAAAAVTHRPVVSVISSPSGLNHCRRPSTVEPAPIKLHVITRFSPSALVMTSTSGSMESSCADAVTSDARVCAWWARVKQVGRAQRVRNREKKQPLY